MGDASLGKGVFNYFIFLNRADQALEELKSLQNHFLQAACSVLHPFTAINEQTQLRNNCKVLSPVEMPGTFCFDAELASPSSGVRWQCEPEQALDLSNRMRLSQAVNILFSICR